MFSCISVSFFLMVCLLCVDHSGDSDLSGVPAGVMFQSFGKYVDCVLNKKKTSILGDSTPSKLDDQGLWRPEETHKLNNVSWNVAVVASVRESFATYSCV